MTRLELKNKQYLSSLLIHAECDRVITRTGALFTTRSSGSVKRKVTKFNTFFATIPQIDCELPVIP